MGQKEHPVILAIDVGIQVVVLANTVKVEKHFYGLG